MRAERPRRWTRGARAPQPALWRLWAGERAPRPPRRAPPRPLPTPVGREEG